MTSKVDFIILPLVMETTVLNPATLVSGEILHLILGTSLVVKIVLGLLLSLSIFTWAILFYKWSEIGRAGRASAKFLSTFSNGGWERLYRLAKDLMASPLAEVYREGYDEVQRQNSSGSRKKDEVSLDSEGRRAVERSMERVASSAMNRLERYLTFLATTGSAAPFIGLFGTVWGIMESFHSIGATGAASIAVVAPGVSEALIATAMGLFAAIPAVAGYNLLLRRVQIMDRELERFISHFVDQLANRS